MTRGSAFDAPLMSPPKSRRAAHARRRSAVVLACAGAVAVAGAACGAALAGCAAAKDDAHDAGEPPSDAAPSTCARDPSQLARYGYRATARVAGACSAQESTDFGAACGPDPGATTCAKFLAKHPSCARCILGDVLTGPLRRDAFGRTEVSPGACAQALAGEAFDAAPNMSADADTTFGGCGASFEDLGACIGYACGACDGGDVELACREAAYRGACASRDPDAPRCDALGAAACLLGPSQDRARATANAVCGAD
jgi:hypothetical protein